MDARQSDKQMRNVNIQCEKKRKMGREGWLVSGERKQRTHAHIAYGDFHNVKPVNWWWQSRISVLSSSSIASIALYFVTHVLSAPNTFKLDYVGIVKYITWKCTLLMVSKCICDDWCGRLYTYIYLNICRKGSLRRCVCDVPRAYVGVWIFAGCEHVHEHTNQLCV